MAETFTPQDHSHRLKRFFIEAGIRQIDLAKHCGISYQAMALMLNGYRTTPPDVNARLFELAEKIKQEKGGNE